MKTVSLQKFQSLKVEISDYQKEKINEEIARAKEISAFHPCEVVVNLSEYDKGIHFEHTQLKLEHKTLDMTIRHDDYRKKYSIFCQNIHSLKNVTHYTIQDEKKKLVEPKNIGVLTTKKINDWMNYYEQLYKALEVINGGNDDKKAKFLASLKGLDVKFWNDGQNGEVIKNGIKFSFKIEPTYIQQTIEVHYECPSTLEAFLQLSNNKYKQAEE
jgi:hypothetical protein